MKDHLDPDLCAMIGSRLCHDLISPIGAISNGMELLEMTSGPPTPEMELIRQSVDNVNARIKFFRIAFGLASAEQLIGRAEVQGILRDYFSAGRLDVQWHPVEDLPRAQVKAALLSLLCVEGALPAGGTIEVAHGDDGWHITGTGTRLRIQEDGWTHLDGGGPTPEGASQVHFALLRQWATATGRPVQTDIVQDAGSVGIRF